MIKIIKVAHVALFTSAIAPILFSCQKNPPAPNYSGCDSVRLGIIHMRHADSIRLSDCLVLSLTDSLSLFPEKILSNGLVAYYPFTGNANDSSGNGNNGTVYGAIPTTDRFGNANSAYYFNRSHWTWGAGGDEIYIPFNKVFNSKDISVSVWFNRKSSQGGQGYVIINRYQYGYSNPNGQTWAIDAGYDVDTFTIHSYIFNSSTTNSQMNLHNTGSYSHINTWINAIFTFDGNCLKLFINGQLQDSLYNANFPFNILGNSGISIGLSDQANGHWGPFDGYIDDVRIYDRALFQPEISYLSNH